MIFEHESIRGYYLEYLLKGKELLGFPDGSAGKESASNSGDLGDWVQPMGWEDPLKEGMATHSSILAQRIPWTEEPGILLFIGSQRVGHD